MKIEILEFNTDQIPGTYYHLLSLDGIVDEYSDIKKYEDDVYLSIRNETTFEKLKKLKFTELEKEFSSIDYNQKDSEDKNDFNLRVIFKNGVDEDTGEIFYKLDPILIRYGMTIDLEKWNSLYTVVELKKEFLALTEKSDSNIYSVEDVELEFNSFPRQPPEIAIITPILNTEAFFEEYIQYSKQAFENIYTTAITNLKNEINPEIISTIFKFPSQIKTACVQYLMYFGQFLADLGIIAKTSVKDELEGTFFNIEPENYNEALEEIKCALEIFLNAPENEVFNNRTEIFEKKDISQIQWEANIYHLKSQLALLQALVDTKDATIQALKLSNFQLIDIISREQGENVLPLSKPKDEEVLGGLVSIKKYDGKAFSINLPEIYRRLKRKFSK